MSATANNSPWKTTEPPRDGTVIVAFGAVIMQDEISTVVEPLFNQIRWTENPGELKGWHFLNGLSVMTQLDDEVRIDFWLEAPR